MVSNYTQKLACQTSGTVFALHIRLEILVIICQNTFWLNSYLTTVGSGQVVRHQVLVLAFGGSNPSSPAKGSPIYLCFTDVAKKIIIGLNAQRF
jgi:hypothetical protein